jgi:alpha-tubulin suppressor-like RCC1 family protein
VAAPAPEAPTFVMIEVPEQVRIPDVTVRGRFADNDRIAELTYTLNEDALIDVTETIEEQEFIFTVSGLIVGENSILINAKAENGLESSEMLSVIFTPTPVGLTLETPVEGEFILGDTVTVRGQVEVTLAALLVTLNEEAERDASDSSENGVFDFELSGLTPGDNTLTLRAVSSDGVEETLSVTVTRSAYEIVSLGSANSGVLRADGQVLVWGQNNFGQLGDDAGDPSSLPQFVPGLENVRAFDYGGLHGIAVLADGGVRTFGANVSGQIGDGTTGGWRPLTEPEGLAEVVAVAASAGSGHNLLLDEVGNVWVWGSNVSGQLGLGDRDSRNVPERLIALDDVDIMQVAAGLSHSLALDTSGQVWAWGGNVQGQLGLGDNEPREEPTIVPFPSGVAITTVAAGSSSQSSFAIDQEGRLWAWGNNVNGQLGLGDEAPEQVLEPTLVDAIDGRVTAVISGGAAATFFSPANLHTLLVVDGTLFAVGANTNGQLGIGQAGDPVRTPVPVNLDSDATVVLVGAGGQHSAALLGEESGVLYTWGNNTAGQLGLGDEERRETPERVVLP